MGDYVTPEKDSTFEIVYYLNFLKIETMRKSEFVSKLAEEAEMTQKDVEKVIDALTPVLVETVVKGGDEISLPFGKFKQKINPAKTGVNQLTKKPMNVPESHTLAFKASKTIKQVMEAKPAKKGKK